MTTYLADYQHKDAIFEHTLEAISMIHAAHLMTEFEEGFQVALEFAGDEPNFEILKIELVGEKNDDESEGD